MNTMESELIKESVKVIQNLMILAHKHGANIDSDEFKEYIDHYIKLIKHVHKNDKQELIDDKLNEFKNKYI